MGLNNINIESLPVDVLNIIAGKLTFEDYMKFREISRFIRNFTIEKVAYQTPWVMLSNNPGDKTRPFYSPLEGKIYNVKLPKAVRRSWCCGSYQGWLILAHKTRGNLVYNPITKVQFKLPTHQLENIYYTDWDRSRFWHKCISYKEGEPRTHRQHIKRSPCFLTKVVLSSVPSSVSSSSPLLAAAITQNHKILITVCHPSQLDSKSWCQFCPVSLKEEQGLLSPVVPMLCNYLIDGEPEKGEDEEVELKIEVEDDEAMYERYITDIVFYKGRLYAINTYGKLMVLHFTDDHEFSIRRVVMHPLKLKRKEMHYLNLCYLVESCHGELLLVVRNRENDGLWINRKHTCSRVQRYQTKKFVVFRLDEANGEPVKWVRMDILGDQVLFLGQNNSMSVASAHIKFLGNAKERRNCIYFTDRLFSHYYIDSIVLCPRIYKDVGVYHLDDGHIDDLVPAELDHHLYTFMRQPIIFTPKAW